MNRRASRGKYLLRGFFATTVGIMWLLSAKQVAPISPQLWIGIFCMAFGAEIVAISLLRERLRGS